MKGGTLRVNASNNDFEFSDPGLAYDTLSWSMLYTTQMLLVNFPEKNGQAGSVLYPEAATSFPTVSRNGLIYTFHIRPGPEVLDGSPVTAAAYQRAWERNLSPKMGSPVGVNDQFQSVVVGAQAFLDGKAQSITGITASGLMLTFKLTKPNPTFTAYMGMQWFGAVKPDMPYTTSGVTTSYPSAGPYYIQSREVGKSLVEARNPYYKGSAAGEPGQDRVDDEHRSGPEPAAGQGRSDRRRCGARRRRPPTRRWPRSTASTSRGSSSVDRRASSTGR